MILSLGKWLDGQPSLRPKVLLCTRLASQRPGLEPVLRPYVMCHIWAASLVPLVKVSVVVGDKLPLLLLDIQPWISPVPSVEGESHCATARC